MTLRCTAAVLCGLLLAAGCGQKGPLYLPGDPNEGRIVIPTPEQEQGADEDEQTEPPPQ
jgi:predicted small lipoprotein YifL